MTCQLAVMHQIKHFLLFKPIFFLIREWNKGMELQREIEKIKAGVRFDFAQLKRRLEENTAVQNRHSIIISIFQMLKDLFLEVEERLTKCEQRIENAFSMLYFDMLKILDTKIESRYSGLAEEISLLKIEIENLKSAKERNKGLS